MTELRKLKEPEEFEFLGSQTMLETGDLELTKEICALHIHAFVDEINAIVVGLRNDIDQVRCKMTALYSHLYDRVEPVNDASMLSRGTHIRLLTLLGVLAALACYVGNTATFYLFGFALWAVLLAAVGMTGLPLVIGHLAYERIVAPNKRLQAAIVLVAVGLCFAGLYRLSEARRLMAEHAAAATTASNPYVESAPGEVPDAEPQPSSDGTEAKVRDELGGAMLLIMLAADLMLGFLVGILAKLRTDEDYVAWQQLHTSADFIAELEQKIEDLLAKIKIVKKRCMAGILQALNKRNKRRPPYHKLALALVFIPLAAAIPSRAQKIERYEGILIDSSQSIGRRGSHDEVFREYLVSVRKLLLTEPPNSKVLVSLISTDSFGGTRELLKGWTPDARGVFTDDLNRARRQLAASFEAKSKKLAPTAQGTDIFGALWRLKAQFESAPSQSTKKEIWIFSDMMNETEEFSMPQLFELGPEQMLERAKANGLLIPLKGYTVHVRGASTEGLSPQAWMRVKEFWTLYLHEAGAEIAVYSADADIKR